MWSVVEYEVCMVCVTFAECVKLAERVKRAFPLRYVEYDIWVACVNFPSLGDEGLELYHSDKPHFNNHRSEQLNGD
jgi:hypothetical protein